MHIGDRVAARRRFLGLTQFQLGERAGVSDAWVSMLEGQKHIENFSLQRVMRVAAELGVSLEWLVNGTGEQPELTEGQETKSPKLIIKSGPDSEGSDASR